ncbi:MAG TPA: hypothetical protein VKN18_27315 [Blastocatellia bacterium]|nr:hypothetical protein [Blastocatellia bacterium]
MNNEAAKQLCHSLTVADSEQAVIDLLTDAGFWEDESAWRYYGDYENNYNTIGNQQSRPDAAPSSYLGLDECPSRSSAKTAA